MIEVRAKENGKHTIVNENNILYISSSLDGGSVIFFHEAHLVVLDTYAELKEQILPTIVKYQPAPVRELLTESVISDSGFDSLPKLPNGNVDKRTLQYKAYIATQTEL
jgi:hypothetical protein